jgi:acyl-CoA reductase-like NAD-dependent aldehyde dehydrogenase
MERFLVAGEWRDGPDSFEVKSPYDGAVVASVASPSEKDVEDTAAAAANAFDETRKLPLHVRSDV